MVLNHQSLTQFPQPKNIAISGKAYTSLSVIFDYFRHNLSPASNSSHARIAIRAVARPYSRGVLIFNKVKS